MSTTVVTDPGHWDDYWQATRLPVVVEKGSQSSTTAIVEVIDRFVASDARLSVLEIGGAPGGYLVHLAREFGHEVCVLDSSTAGVELTRRNFALLGVPGTVLHRDLFSQEPVPRQFDVVYSLGLIEHFADLQAVIGAHLRYLKPGGTLIVGCPNLLGVNGAIMRRLAPSVFDWHVLAVMDIGRWAEFETALGLAVRFRGYVAGFQPGAFWRCERRTIPSRALARALASLGRHWQGALPRRLASVNARAWSYYAMGVYEKPAA
jgi:SAM-dependent methyltransferase